MEDLGIFMPMYNLLEYSQNNSLTSGSSWNYYREKIDDTDDNASDGKSFTYKTKIIGKTLERPARPRNEGDADRAPKPDVPTLNVEVTIRHKYLSNFLEISWFTTDKLWNRTWFIIEKRLCIDRTSW